MIKSCMNCQDRRIGCHAECEKYKAEKEKVEQIHINKDEYYKSYSTMFREWR